MREHLQTVIALQSSQFRISISNFRHIVLQNVAQDCFNTQSLAMRCCLLARTHKLRCYSGMIEKNTVRHDRDRRLSLSFRISSSMLASTGLSRIFSIPDTQNPRYINVSSWRILWYMVVQYRKYCFFVASLFFSAPGVLGSLSRKQ